MNSHSSFARAAPALFVFLWSTGFIGSRLGLPYCEPMTFLTWRFAIVALLLVVIVRVTGSRPPPRWQDYGHLAISGVLLHTVYIGAVFSAIDNGLTSGLAALIVGVQPLVTAVMVGPLLGERLVARQWVGFVLGFGGLVLVLSKAFDRGQLPLHAVGLALLGLAGITLGTLYQKRHVVNVDLWSGSLVQFIAALIPGAAIALAFETGDIEWSGRFVFALAWLCLVLSLGAISVLWYLIKHGAAAQVASLFYLVPPATAVEAWLLFDETLTVSQMAGIAVTAFGVALINRPSRQT